jgi:hypothetical protein
MGDFEIERRSAAHVREMAAVIGLSIFFSDVGRALLGSQLVTLRKVTPKRVTCVL